MSQTIFRSCLALSVFLFAAASAHAQFDTVINLPGDPVFGDYISGNIGNQSGEPTPTTQLNVFDGGGVDYLFNANYGSTVNISGGTLDYLFFANSGSEVNISGGSVGNYFHANSGSEVNISGGSVGRFFRALSGSEVNISGGSVGDDFHAASGSRVNLVGDDFRIDGVPVAGLGLGQALEIADRDVTLSGVLADGSAFSFDLNSVDSFPIPNDFFDEDATLTVSLEAPFLLGDVNRDDILDFLDIAPFIEVLLANDFQDEADIDRDGDVDFLDIAPFIAILTAQ